MRASFDPSKNLDLYFRRNRNGSIALTFLSDGAPFDLAGQDFSFRSDFSVTATVNENVLTLSYSKDTVATRSTYFWELYNAASSKTWLSGTAFFTDALSAEVDDEQTIQLNINGDQVEINITSSDVNGGTP